MNAVKDIEPTSEITSEGCAWIAQLESGSLTASDMAALREWMDRSPAHAREIREIAEMSGGLSMLTELAPMLERSAGATHPVRRSVARQFFAPLLAACAIVFASGVVTFTMMMEVDRGPEIYQTAIGEYRTLVLSDGTQVSLNTHSQIEVDFSDRERRVRLVGGEALFDVVSNARRPFVVYSDNAVAEVVGTSFLVRLRDNVTELAVVEGVVAFSPLRSSIDEPTISSATDMSTDSSDVIDRVMVNAGHALSSNEFAVMAETPAREIPVLSERALLRKLSWRDGFLEFSDSRLEDVVAELTRHNAVSIAFADPALKELKFGGIFRTGDVEELLGALEGLGVAVERHSDTEFTLHIANAE